MSKLIRKHLKDQKRIIKLMYQKGMFEYLEIDFDSLGWEDDYRRKKATRLRFGKTYKSVFNYLPELHVYWSDYWGEGDSISIVKQCRNALWFDNSVNVDENGFPNSDPMSNKELIGYLEKLPTKVFDSKINKVLKRDYSNM